LQQTRQADPPISIVAAEGTEHSTGRRVHDARPHVAASTPSSPLAPPEYRRGTEEREKRAQTKNGGAKPFGN